MSETPEQLALRHHHESVGKFGEARSLEMVHIRMSFGDFIASLDGPEEAQAALTLLTRQMQELINGFSDE